MKPVVALTLALLTLTACSENNKEAPVELSQVQIFMADPAAVRRGQAIFEGSCANFCHAIHAQSASPETVEFDAHYLFDCEWKHGETDQDIFDVVTVGIAETRMVGFGSNFPQGDDDLWKIIAYLRSNQQTCSE